MMNCFRRPWLRLPVARSTRRWGIAFALGVLFLSSPAVSADPSAADSSSIDRPPDSPFGEADFANDAPLPFDPKTRQGRFDNGLTYYIRENREPRSRAELRLVVNAGSVLEQDEQQGLAHFLEHMAFNGMEN
jgi:zinc protease